MEKFIARGFIREFADIFHLSQHREEIVSMEGFGEKSYENLAASIEKSRNTTQPRLLYSLGIPNIGVANAKMICKAFDYDLVKSEARMRRSWQQWTVSDPLSERRWRTILHRKECGRVGPAAFGAEYRDSEDRGSQTDL